jgi:hypothetical protein
MYSCASSFKWGKFEFGSRRTCPPLWRRWPFRLPAAITLHNGHIMSGCNNSSLSVSLTMSELMWHLIRQDYLAGRHPCNVRHTMWHFLFVWTFFHLYLWYSKVLLIPNYEQCICSLVSICSFICFSLTPSSLFSHFLSTLNIRVCLVRSGASVVCTKRFGVFLGARLAAPYLRTLQAKFGVRRPSAHLKSEFAGQVRT